jgi:hypothetical protein
MRLSKRSIDGLVYQGDGGHYEWDDDLAGFGVRVYPSGRKSFVITYRCHGRQRFWAFARYGEKTPEEARTRAMKLLALAREGKDPRESLQAMTQTPTMRELAERYQREHAEVKKKPHSGRST